MKGLRYIGVVVLGLLLLSAQAGGEPRKDNRMKRKLESSQKVLEGVAVGDYKLIEKHAEELLIISKEAGWKVLKTPEYELYSNDFRRHAESLMKSGREKNLDASALTYVELTLTCVKCHKYVREVRMSSLD